MNEFSEKYKRFNTVKLLRIIAEADKYRPEAVAAARDELATRDIAPSEQEEVQQQLEKERFAQHEFQEKVAGVEQKAKSIGDKLRTVFDITKAKAQKIIIATFALFSMLYYYWTL